MTAATGIQTLEFRIAAGKDSFSVGEPVRLTLELRNTGASPVKLPKFFMLPADAPGKNTLEIHVRDQAGRRLTRISHVLTGRALYYPETVSIDAGAVYQQSLQIAGTFMQKQDRKKIERALWSLGEDPVVASANEYPPMSSGAFRVEAVYRVEDRHLLNLDKAERPTVLQGELISNTIDILIE